MSHFIYFHSCHSHHRVYYELTMACFPVSFISLMDRALRPIIAKARVRFQVKSNFFFRFFFTRLLRLLVRLRGSFPLSWNFKQFAILNSWGNVNRPTNRNARGNNFVHFKTLPERKALMPKIDGAHKNYLTPEIWEETHLREIFYGTLIFQQSSMICIGRHVGGQTLALQHGGQNYFLLVSC